LIRCVVAGTTYICIYIYVIYNIYIYIHTYIPQGRKWLTFSRVNPSLLEALGAFAIFSGHDLGTEDHPCLQREGGAATFAGARVG
jgi:hypothetical protein